MNKPLDPNPYPPGTVIHRLFAETAEKQPIAPRPKAPPAAERAPRKVVRRVRATGAGRSRPLASSTRGAVLAHVAAAPGGECSIEELESHFKTSVRGYIQKLMEKGHLVAVEPEQ